MRLPWITLFPALLALATTNPVPTLVIVEKASGKVGFFNADGLVKEVPVGVHPHEMAFSSNGRFLLGVRRKNDGSGVFFFLWHVT